MNVMYFSYQPYFIDMAEIMENRGWTAVYWSIVPEAVPEVKKRFPKAICHNQYDAIRGIPPSEYTTKQLATVCPSVFQELVHAEKIAMRMLERNDSHTDSFSYRERSELFRYLVMYWLMVIEDLSPDYVLFEEEPHNISDFVLYEICKLKNIETIMFVITKFPTLLPVGRFETGSDAVQQTYQALKPQYINKEVPASKLVEDYFTGIQGTYDNAIAIHLFDQVEEATKMLHGKNRFFDEFLGKLSKLASLFSLQDMLRRWRLVFSKAGTVFVSDQKERNKSFRDSQMSYVQHIYYKTKSIRKKRYLKSFYETLTDSSVELDKPYIFVAMHYQPEKTTSPCGGDFDDQIYMLQMLSSALPDGWSLYVKEHPMQFVPDYARFGENFRSENYYNTLHKMKGVKLLPLNSNAFEFIDKAQAVATVCGTSSWESVIRGVPSLTFGYAWFMGCEGVFYTPTLEAVRSAIEKIENGYEVNPNLVKLYASVVDEYSFRGMVGGPRTINFCNITQQENAEGHVQAIESYLEFKAGENKKVHASGSL